MPSETDRVYEFGEFTLIPSERILLRSRKVISISPGEFTVLSYLVANANTTVKEEDIFDAPYVRDDGSPSRRLSNHVVQIRRILEDDPVSPRFIKSVFRSGGYKFVAPVRSVDRSEIQKEWDPQITDGKDLRIRTHLLVPMYIGENVYSGLPAAAINVGGVDLKQVSYEKKMLYLAPTGFAVWHVETTDSFPNLTDFAYWRREIYSAIQSGRHSISRFTKEIIRVNAAKSELNDLVARPGYVFSLNAAANLPYRNRETILNALKILACPSALVMDGRVEHPRVRSRSIENLLLERGVPIKDIIQFGFADIGFASWDSLSYLASANSAFEEKIIEFEIAVQTLWWTARTIADIFLSGDPKKIDSVRKLVPDVRRQYSRLKAIGSTETPAERTMIEAVLATSRIDSVVNEAFELAKQIGD